MQSTFGASRTRIFLSKRVPGGIAGSIAARIPALKSKSYAIKETMMEIYDAEALQAKDLAAVLARPRIDFTSILDTVRRYHVVNLIKRCGNGIGVIVGFANCGCCEN